MNSLTHRRREAILKLQGAMEALPDEIKINPPVKHYFAKGAYAREIILPKGSRVVGKIHRHGHMNSISYGKVLVFTDQGKEILEGPINFVSLPGTKRVVVALEDTMWTTFHVTDKTDLAEIEKEIIADSYEALESPYFEVLP